MGTTSPHETRHPTKKHQEKSLSMTGNNNHPNIQRETSVATLSDDDRFIADFESGRWPLDQWRHREHIKVAYLYLCKYPFETAMSWMRERIKAYNAAHHVPDLPTRGYHETMTQVWMQLIYVTICEYGRAETADLFYDQNPQLAEKRVLRLFYSRDLLMSPRAKTEFVEPDLAPLPRSKNQPTL